MALIPELTNSQIFQVAVRPESFVAPPCCFVCPETDTTQIELRFTRSMGYGLGGWVESAGATVKLCPLHRRSYEARSRTLLTVQLVCGAIAALAAGCLFLTFPERVNGQRTPGLISEDAGTIFIVVAVAAVFVAGATLPFRSTVFPVEFSARQHDRWFQGGHGAWVFKFPDAGGASRFATVNR